MCKQLSGARPIVTSTNILVKQMSTKSCWRIKQKNISFIVVIATEQIVLTSENLSFIVLARELLRFLCLNAVYIVRPPAFLKCEVLILVFWSLLIISTDKANLPEKFVVQFSDRQKLGNGE